MRKGRLKLTEASLSMREKAIDGLQLKVFTTITSFSIDQVN